VKLIEMSGTVLVGQGTGCFYIETFCPRDGKRLNPTDVDYYTCPLSRLANFLGYHLTGFR